MDKGAGKGGGAAIRGLRLVTMKRGSDGFGFHMYTNKQRDGQFVKNVSPNSPADLSGMLPGDRIVAVDGHIVLKETHHQVVERVRRGQGDKKILLIDPETEDEMNQRGEEINPDEAIVMMSREPPPPPPEVETETKPDFDLPSLDEMKKFGIGKKREVKTTKSWKESVEAYNNL